MRLVFMHVVHRPFAIRFLLALLAMGCLIVGSGSFQKAQCNKNPEDLTCPFSEFYGGVMTSLDEASLKRGPVSCDSPQYEDVLCNVFANDYGVADEYWLTVDGNVPVKEVDAKTQQTTMVYTNFRLGEPGTAVFTPPALCTQQ